MKPFESELKRERRRVGMSQPQMARALGVHWMSISRWERGVEVPRLAAAILALARTLKPLPRGERRFGKSGRPPGK